MIKPNASTVAAKAIEIAEAEKAELESGKAEEATTYAYGKVDCQAFVELCVNRCGGKMAYKGSNDMLRNACAYLATISNAKAEGKLVPGAGLLIIKEVSESTPKEYRGDGLGDATHVGFFVGDGALYDVDSKGKSRLCNTVHSSDSRKRVVGGTLGGGWTHVILFKEIDYDVDIPTGVALSGTLTVEDTTKENPEGIADTTDVSRFYTVKRGSKGGAVRRLQTWLQDLGYVLLVDHDFGPATENAVRYFQKTHGLTEDGVVGRKTWAAMAEARNAAITASQQKQSGGQNE